ncbi:MerR family transcriptional regulator [Ottowia caeni]|uniref:MerR family transcriptional regulator n=1 Tax=Ottowia caeni TaxID=2870339 RepID=UPI001E2A6E80|nr:cobalamin-dependent protein [Ottowia caeni]
MNANTPITAEAGLPIAAVERETGLAKDTLRVWEKRYGFPQPLRDLNGDRLYPADQVQRLQLIRRLLDAGLRPGKVVGLGSSELQHLLEQQGPTQRKDSSRTDPDTGLQPVDLEPLLAIIAAHNPQALRHALHSAQMRMGLAPFVTELASPLTSAVGDAWARGRFEVFEEHIFTEVITGVLRQAISSLPPFSASTAFPRPKVLLTTVPQELHGLGLLMVEALLALEGCNCVSLGTQTPLGDIVQAAQAHHADVVALSFSSVQSGPVVVASLRELRAQLPQRVDLWVGGSCAALYQKPIDGITAVQPLSALSPLVTRWSSTRLSYPTP